MMLLQNECNDSRNAYMKNEASVLQYSGRRLSKHKKFKQDTNGQQPLVVCIDLCVHLL